MAIPEALAACPGLLYAVSVVADGNMAFRYGDAASVARHRAAFLSRAGVLPERCVVMQVEHGNAIVPVSAVACGAGALDPDSLVTAEALMTDESHVGLFLLTADCLPVVYCDPVRGAIALAHLGWRPSVKGLAVQVVREMQAIYDTHPQDLYITIGPGIRKESYAFERLDQEASSEWKQFIERDAAGKWHVDLVGFNTAQLVAVGVSPEHIAIDPIDTAVSPQYFSHVRATQTGEPEGRFATVIMRSEEG
jgi:hypothetical protein